MRAWSFFALLLAGCRGSTIDAGGNGVSTPIASQIQLTPTNLASDGTSVFWISSVGTGGPISSVPVTGGAIATVVPGDNPGDPTFLHGGFFAVDDVNVYLYGDLQNGGGLFRAPKKGGGSPMQIAEPVGSITALGATVYWTEIAGITDDAGPLDETTVTVKSAPLQGGAISVVAQFSTMKLVGPGQAIGVTATTGFYSSWGFPLMSFPLDSSQPDGGTFTPVAGVPNGCGLILSDVDAIYCATDSIVRVASDGTTTMLGTREAQGLSGWWMAVDDSNFYWLDSLPVGTIMRVPKKGGTAAVIARDTSPVAIAVDAHAVYWSDTAGNIMRLGK